MCSKSLMACSHARAWADGKFQVGVDGVRDCDPCIGRAWVARSLGSMMISSSSSVYPSVSPWRYICVSWELSIGEGELP